MKQRSSWQIKSIFAIERQIGERRVSFKAESGDVLLYIASVAY